MDITNQAQSSLTQTLSDTTLKAVQEWQDRLSDNKQSLEKNMMERDDDINKLTGSVEQFLSVDLQEDMPTG